MAEKMAIIISIFITILIFVGILFLDVLILQHLPEIGMSIICLNLAICFAVVFLFDKVADKIVRLFKRSRREE